MFPEVEILEPLLKALASMNRTIVSDDMDRAADLLDEAVGFPSARHRYPSGTEYGSWIVPPSWNVREAFLSDGERRIASYEDHVLFLAPYSAPFEGWVSRQELMDHLVTSNTFDDVFVYQHRIAYDFYKRLQRWEISLPRVIAASLSQDRYFVKIDVDVRPGTMNVLEYTANGAEETSVAILTHLCHPGQANDGLSGVLAGVALIRRLARRPHRFTYKLLILPETIGSAVHVVAQGLSTRDFTCAVFLETMGRGDRLFLKRSRLGDRPIDAALNGLVRDRPEIGIHGFFEGYGNDEMVFDFANVNIPAVGIQYHPFAEYHTSRDAPETLDWQKIGAAVELAEELFRRIEVNRLIQLRHPGPPYLSRYRLYADAVTERPRYVQIAKLLTLCDGHHSLLEICEKTGLPFDDVSAFFDVLQREGLLA
jgi:aminopeptidase-like protein